MDLKLNSQGDLTPEVINALGATVTNYVTLTELPPTFAATKKYVDDIFSGLDITGQNITITPASVVGAVTGDLVAGAGNTLVLIPRIIAGTYPAVTVNTKGLVTTGGLLASSDLPLISWSKILLDVSTDTHGITDALLNTGGTFTGNLSLSAAPSVAAHAASKGYVDGLAAGPVSTGVAVGDIIYKLTGGSYSGYFICNGGDLSRATYASLFSVVGTAFNLSVSDGAYAGAGKPFVRQYEFNLTQTAALGAWTTYTSMPATVYYSSAIVTKSRVFVLGGLVSGGWSAVIYTAPINADGTLGTWTTSTSLPATVGYSEAIVLSGGTEATSRVYVLASQVASAESAVVYSAPINTDGTLGAWVTVSPLPINLRYTHAVQTKTKLYLLGGMSNAVAMATVYSASVNADGSLGFWVAETSLPATVAYSQAVVIKDKVYLLGGQIAGAFSATVYQATISSSGTIGVWSVATSLPVTYGYGQAAIVNARVYLIAGQVNGAASSAVYSAPIDASGVIGTWTLGGAALPGTLVYSACIVTSSKVYTLGGLINGGASNVVYSTDISGGRNDYSQMYSGGYLGTSSANFKLPDLSLRAQSGMSHYIKF